MLNKNKLFRLSAALVAIVSAIGGPMTMKVSAATSTPISIYGAWFCDNYCNWQTNWSAADVATGGTFDHNNHWFIDRGNGQPSVNLISFAFVKPTELLNKVNSSTVVNGIPIGMNTNTINYFKSHGIRVMLSMGGQTYTADWDTALATNATQLGLNAAAVAQQFGVGFEIDWEENTATSTQIAQMDQFIQAYRSVLPYDATGSNPANRLTIDIAEGDRYLISIQQYAVPHWLSTTSPVLDYANAMDGGRQDSLSGYEASWTEHRDGKPNYAPPIAPLAPAKYTGALFAGSTNQSLPECTDYNTSLQKSLATFVQTLTPNASSGGTTTGMLGYMFWGTGHPSDRKVDTYPPHSCENGIGAGATALNVPIPMPALRQS